MTNQRKYDIGSVRRAIEAVGASPSAIADYLGCARSTVYGYLRKHPELKVAYEDARGESIEERVQYPREAFARAIENSKGIKSVIAHRVGCTRQTVDNALERWADLTQMVEDERESIVDLAEGKLVQAVSDGEMRAILYTLETLGKNRGWSKRTEVTGANGEALISADVARLIAEMGLDSSEVVRQFESMVRAAAVKKGIE